MQLPVHCFAKGAARLLLLATDQAAFVILQVFDTSAQPYATTFYSALVFDAHLSRHVTAVSVSAMYVE